MACCCDPPVLHNSNLDPKRFGPAPKMMFPPMIPELLLEVLCTS